MHSAEPKKVTTNFKVNDNAPKEAKVISRSSQGQLPQNSSLLTPSSFAFANSAASCKHKTFLNRTENISNKITAATQKCLNLTLHKCMKNLKTKWMPATTISEKTKYFRQSRNLIRHFRVLQNDTRKNSNYSKFKCTKTMFIRQKASSAYEFGNSDQLQQEAI